MHKECYLSSPTKKNPGKNEFQSNFNIHGRDYDNSAQASAKKQHPAKI